MDDELNILNSMQPRGIADTTDDWVRIQHYLYRLTAYQNEKADQTHIYNLEEIYTDGNSCFKMFKYFKKHVSYIDYIVAEKANILLGSISLVSRPRGTVVSW